MATGKVQGQRKETKETLGGGGKGVAAPKSGLDDALDQMSFLSWRDFRKSMEMGATVLSARYSVACLNIFQVPWYGFLALNHHNSIVYHWHL